MVKILQQKEKILRAVSRQVPLKDIGSQKIQKIISDMKTAMHAEEDAVAIAAPQIGVLFRIFIVSGKIFLKRGKDDEQPAQHELPPDLIFINPKLLKYSQKDGWVEEGCLSVRWLYGEVKRSEKATIRACNERGVEFTRGASGILAQIFQHEIEHLDGILFIDKARNIKNIPPDKTRENKSVI